MDIEEFIEKLDWVLENAEIMAEYEDSPDEESSFDAAEALQDLQIENHKSFESAMVLTRDHGFRIKLKDGSKFDITITEA